MTSETRTYIELGDIIGLELKCARCQSATQIPIAQADKPMTSSRNCPNCGWTMISPDEAGRFDQLIRLLRFGSSTSQDYRVHREDTKLRLQVRCQDEEKA